MHLSNNAVDRVQYYNDYQTSESNACLCFANFWQQYLLLLTPLRLSRYPGHASETITQPIPIQQGRAYRC